MITAAPPAETPDDYTQAIASADSAQFRQELRVIDTAAPQGLAPYQRAWAADVEPSRTSGDDEYGTGRLVFLYDPSSPDAWGSCYRMVVFAQAPIDHAMGSDQFLADVAWSWLIDALNNAGANYAHAAGTTTTVLSTGFGELADEGKGSQIEVRASWSPTNGELKSHLEAWSEFVCMLAGFPPSIDGVSAMPDTRPTP